MHVVWERGYGASSIADLTSAMGITPPSLHTACGDKARLLLETIEPYALGRTAPRPGECRPDLGACVDAAPGGVCRTGAPRAPTTGPESPRRLPGDAASPALGVG